MTVEEYEKEGGFRDELRAVRVMGEGLTLLTRLIPCRPHRSPELAALHEAQSALERLRAEICRTRDL